MQRLIITWEYSDPECSATYVECVEYESPEALLKLLEDETKKFMDAHAAYREAYDKWNDKHSRIYYKKRTGNKADREATRDAETSEHFKSMPNPPSGTLNVSGKLICLGNFTRSEWQGKKQVHAVSLPEVYPLDEWFDLKANGTLP